MDLKSFHLMGEDEKSYKVGHPNGRALTIDKAGLSEKAHAVIKKLSPVQHLADGGDVLGNAITNLQAAEAPSSELSSAAPAAEPIEPAIQAAVAQPPAQAPSGGEIPIAQPTSQDPLIQNKLDTAGLLNSQQSDIQNYEKSATGAAAQKAQVLNQYNEDQETAQTPEDVAQEHNAKDAQLADAYAKQTIDPNRYWANQSTPSKVSAAIGLLFSGFGSGASGQQNLALNQINKAVDDDIDAQKNAQGKTLNLMNINQKAYGNDLAAQSATQNQLLTGVQAKLAQAASGVEGADAKLKAQQMINQIQQQKLQNNLKLGLLTQGQNSPIGGAPGQSKANPLDLVNDMVPEAQKKTVIDELGKAQHVAQNRTQMLDLFDKAGASGWGTPGGNTILRTGFGLRTPPAIATLQALGDPLIHDEVGRVNEFEKKDFNNLLPHPGDTDEHIKEKREGFIKYLDDKAQAPTARANGIDVNHFASTSSVGPAGNLSGQQQQLVQRAQMRLAQNPGDANAAAYLQKVGMR